MLLIPSVLHAIYDAIRFGSFERRISYHFLNSAKAIDIMCNTMFSNLLNAWFIKHGAYHFGVEGETVSSALGKNEILDTLTYLGKGLVGVLGIIQKDHCYISVNDDSFYLLEKPKPISWIITIPSLIIFISVLFSAYQLFKFIF